jgi:PIN domain nuclease of toxin-antitoxin system
VKLLLDTHAFLWWLDGDRRLSLRARRAIAAERNAVWVSALSAFEIVLKARLGRLPRAAAVADDLAGAILSQEFIALDVTVAHAQRAGDLPLTHRDPFDRLLAAQAIHEGLHFVSNDEAFDRLGVARYW